MPISAHPRLKLLGVLCAFVVASGCAPSENEALYAAAKREIGKQYPQATLVRPISEMTTRDVLGHKFVTVQIERPGAEAVESVELEFMAENDNWILAPKDKSNQPFKTNVVMKTKIKSGQPIESK